MICKERIKEIFNTLKGDTSGGIIAAIVALPQALAFGVATGFGAIAGLWGAILLCFFAGVFGANTPLISGPTGPCTIALTSVLAHHNFSPDSVISILVLAAIFQLLISLTNCTQIVKYVPYPVISGFMNGVGVLLIIMQINPLFGHKVLPSVIDTITGLSTVFAGVNKHALLLGLITLAVCFLIPKRFNRFLPSQLAALILGTLISIHFDFNVEKISHISLELPKFFLPHPSLKQLIEYTPYALILAIVCSSESLLSSLVADSLTKKQSDSNKTIAAQGIGNLMCALTGSLIGAAAAMRTAAAVKNGASTKFASIVSTIVLLAVLFKLGNFAAQIPLAVLAGILIKIGYDIIDTKFLKVIKHAPKDDLYVLFLVFFLTVFYNLVFAVASGIVFAALLYAKRVADRTNLKIQEVYDKEIMKIEKKLEHDSHHKIRVVHINGQFFFGSATQLVSQFDELLGTKYLILNYESDEALDISAVFALEDIITRLHSQNIKVLLVVKNTQVLEQLTNLKITDIVKDERIFCRETEAIEFSKQLLKKKVKNDKRFSFFDLE